MSPGTLSFVTKTEVAVIAGAFGAFALYWNLRIHRQPQELLAIAQPFQAACRQKAGCTLGPPGWEKQRDSSGSEFYFNADPKYGMKYSATASEFKIEWHVATDVDLIAEGGVNRELTVRKDVE